LTKKVINIIFNEKLKSWIFPSTINTMKYELKVFRKLTKKVINIIFNEKYFRQQYNFIKNIKFKIGRRSHCQRPDYSYSITWNWRWKNLPFRENFEIISLTEKLTKKYFIFEIIIFFRPQISASMEHLSSCEKFKMDRGTFRTRKTTNDQRELREVAINGNLCSTSF
jgi:hypothetical protein